MSRFYETATSIVKPLAHLLYPLEVEGRENVPEGAVILCPNHSHWLDPVFLVLALGKQYKTRQMAKKELFKIPGVSWFIRGMGAFPVDRGNNDISAMKTSLKSLKEGISLILFPEGTRVKKPGAVKAHKGAIVLAIQSGVDVVPVYIDVKKRIFHKVRIVFGKPYHPVYTPRKGTPEEHEKNIDEVMKQIYSLGGMDYNAG